MKISIGKKLLGAFSVLLIIMVLSGAMAVLKMYQLNEKVSEFTSSWLPGLEAIMQINTELQTIYAYDQSLYSTVDKAEKEGIIKQIDEHFAMIDQKIAIYETTIQSEEERQIFLKLKRTLAEYKTFNTLAVESGRRVDVSTPATPEILLQLEELKKQSDVLFAERKEYVDQLIRLNSEGSQEATRVSNQIYQEGIRDNLILLAISLAGGIALAVLLTRNIRTPLNKLVENVKEVAAGNLRVEPLRIKNRDELAVLTDSFNEMTGNLQMLIRQVSTTSEQVASSAEELTASADQTSKATEQIAVIVQEVAAGTDRQVKSVGDGATAVREMTSSIQHIAVNAQSASQTAVQVADIAGEGNQAIQAAVRQMNAIHESIRELAGSVEGLGAHSQAIGQIIEVITGIAEQTNLLALNAAIEAARAGEHGRGFAVVADEVRKLAEQSSKSASQIAQLIKTIQEETTRAVASMEAGNREVQSGIQVVHQAGDTFDRIQMSIRNVTEQIQDVSASAQQVSAHTDQVLDVMNLISEVSGTAAEGTQSVSAATEEQLASMEEIASSATALSKMAEELQVTVARFKV
ncbi:MCP four helix bundle domain-containing protein [Brevibacillus composti]|uniref:MCP four helix bundle domain-containing protein n=1 Tax=Brevibacillus composti TaxID=2796470 RepID=A0A7T5EJQ9_9BACL|nr:methyl-accepting chemotaxis protein [Brevibacillus composti]QQE73900.1 MCP four helix bundle domain-containing protein [Brevibacillus composti]QUO40985.1 MCP four helix bundle domain-containing protein [Brevibacillus composti]